MDLLLRHSCLSQCAQTRGCFQTHLIRLFWLGLLLTSSIRGYAQTITQFTTETTTVNGVRQYIGHVTLSNLLPTYVPASKGASAHWVYSPTTVTLSSANPAVAQAPASVIVGNGSLTASFPIATSPVSADTVVGITATFNRSTRTANLVVRAPSLSSLTFQTPLLTSNFQSSVIITLNSPAPASGVTLTLQHPDSELLGIPDTVSVPAGSATVAVPFSVGKVMFLTYTGISATLRDVTLSAHLSLLVALPFDINSDGHNDLLLQNTTTGDVGVWFMNGATLLGGNSFPTQLGPGWNVAGIFGNSGNTPGHRYPGLVFQNAADGRVMFEYFNGTNIVGAEEVSFIPEAGYKVVSTAPFRGDGFVDLVLQSQKTHEIVVWYMAGSYVSGGAKIPTVPVAGWNVVGAADFNQDGQSDLLFQNAFTGQIAVWYMDGTRVKGTGLLSTIPPAGWQVKGIADYNNDGKPDIVLLNTTTRQVQIWFMNGLTVTGNNLLSLPVSAPYQIVGPR